MGFDLFGTGDDANQFFRAGMRDYNQGSRDARSAITSGFDKSIEGYDKAENRGGNFLSGAYGTATGHLNSAIPLWAGISDRANGGMDAYWSLLKNPDSVFDSELYRARENAGVDQINRGANARGMLASGNNTQDILNYMRQGGLDYYNTLLGGYRPYFDLANEGAQGQTDLYTKLANLDTGYGTARSNLTTGTASNVANQYTNKSTNLKDIALAKGQAGLDNQVRMANADQAATGLSWSGILGLLNPAANLAGNWLGGPTKVA